MIEIGRNCIHLQSLNISLCNNITDTAMIEIGRNCNIKVSTSQNVNHIIVKEDILKRGNSFLIFIIFTKNYIIYII